MLFTSQLELVHILQAVVQKSKKNIKKKKKADKRLKIRRFSVFGGV